MEMETIEKEFVAKGVYVLGSTASQQFYGEYKKLVHIELHNAQVLPALGFTLDLSSEAHGLTYYVGTVYVQGRNNEALAECLRQAIEARAKGQDPVVVDVREVLQTYTQEQQDEADKKKAEQEAVEKVRAQMRARVAEFEKAGFKCEYKPDDVVVYIGSKRVDGRNSGELLKAMNALQPSDLQHEIFSDLEQKLERANKDLWESDHRRGKLATWLEKLIKTSDEHALERAGLINPQSETTEEEELTNEQQEALQTCGLDC